ncbi:hypothetical protein [Nonomuraea sp. NPDC049400]|uniref:hypothetical protein n=1 Tax=Nonomuraea sp. NPDC049400 TaxID=3364352 RepID=UPI0037A70C9B
MDVALPPQAAGMMEQLGPWPSIEVDDVRSERDAVRAASAGTAQAASGADAAARSAQQSYRSQSAAGFDGQWARTGADGGHLAQAQAAMNIAPVALECGAAVISAVKVAAATQAVYTSVKVARALLVGGPLGPSHATAHVLAGRRTVGRILHEGIEGTGKDIGDLIRRRITEPMRRIYDDLHHPGGRGGGPALAGAGGRNVPLRPAGRGGTSGPRSVQDGMAQMGRNNKKGRSSGGGARVQLGPCRPAQGRTWRQRGRDQPDALRRHRETRQDAGQNRVREGRRRRGQEQQDL